MRGWLTVHPEKALAWRGEFGETMMHWAFLSDWVFACELKDRGLSFEACDKDGRNPMDWLNDRLFGAVVNETTKGQLSLGGQERLRKHTEQQVLSLWNMSARPLFGLSPKNGFYGTVWLHAGCFSLLPLAEKEHGLRQWMNGGASILHACVLAPQFAPLWPLLDRLVQQLDIDTEDDMGRTPLWYCVDTWVKHPTTRPSMEKMASYLISLEASPLHKDQHGFSPMDVLQFIEGTTDVSPIKQAMFPTSSSPQL